MPAPALELFPHAMTPGHKPVMLHEVIDWLAPRDHGTYIDGTFGAGSYSHAILQAANCRVFAIDLVPERRALDIDTAEDLAEAERLLNLVKS